MLFERIRVTGILIAILVGTGTCSGQRNLKEIPKPDPVAERAQMKVHELADVNLFASDPDFSKPIQINFDETGGLWIASSEVYPQIRPGEAANDKIVVLRDTDADGVADQRTVFADGLLIPTGVIPDGPHAAYVAESTRLLYLVDTDHDGVADQRRVVLSGFGTEDTHHLVHTLRFGPDGCLYFNQSIYIHSHIQTPYGTRHLDGGGIWRYRPSDGRLEVVCKGFVNPWGHVFDAVGESFATDGAYFEGINYVFPDSVFATSPGASRWLKGMNPGSPKHCGLEILSGTHIPDAWQGDLVTNDFRSHRVCRFSIEPDGSGYSSRQQPELVTTPHVAFRPIDVRMGPDGAIYIADWYNPIIQHGEVDFRDERRDRKHGRIWRISFPGRDPDRWPNFGNQSIEQLWQLLNDPSLSVRQFARQALWKRAIDSPERVLEIGEQWAVRNPSMGPLELSWIRESVPSPIDEAPIDADLNLAGGLQPAAKRTVLRSLWRRRGELGAQKRRQVEQFVLDQTASEDPRVRLEAIVCAGQVDANSYPRAILQVLAGARLPMDQNLDFAVWQSIRNLDQSHDDGSLLNAHGWTDRTTDLARAISAIENSAAAEVGTLWLESNATNPRELIEAVALAGDADQLGRVVRALVGRPSGSLDQLVPILERTKRDGTAPNNVGSVLADASKRWLTQDAKASATLANLATMTGAWKVIELEPVLFEALQDIQRTSTESKNQSTSQGARARDEARIVEARVIEALGAFDTKASRSALKRLATEGAPMTRVTATGAIASRRPGAAVDLIVELLVGNATGDAAMDLVVRQLGRENMPKKLALAMENKSLTTDRARELLRRVRGAGGNAELEQAIRSAGRLDEASWKLTAELRDEVLARVQDSGDAARGQLIYRREKLQCIQCHAIGVGGGLVGPNLISIGGSSQPDYILESLLEPNAKLKEGYTTLNLLTVDGNVVNGIVVGRTAESVRLRLADGKEVQIASEDIEVEKVGKSLMPEGLLDSLTKAELVDLTTFLAAVGRDPDFTVSTEPIVRTVETLVYTDEANGRLNRTSLDTAASDDPAMQWRSMTTYVDGSVPIDELDRFKQHRQTPPMSFIRFTIKNSEAGPTRLDVPVDGVIAWVDAKPTPVAELKALVLPAGTHTIVLGVDREVQAKPFKVLRASP